MSRRGLWRGVGGGGWEKGVGVEGEVVVMKMFLKLDCGNTCTILNLQKSLTSTLKMSEFLGM